MPSTGVTPANLAPVNNQFSFGAGTHRVTTPFDYSIRPLGSSPTFSSPINVGETWKPRTYLTALSAMPSVNLLPKLSKTPSAKPDQKAKATAKISSGGKGSRDTDDFGGAKTEERRLVRRPGNIEGEVRELTCCISGCLCRHNRMGLED